MPAKVGTVVEGTVTGITNFGAFVQLPSGKAGLVHISEISHDYVNNINDYLKKNQKVKVKILSIDGEGKISLSIRQAQPKKSSSKPEEIDWTSKSDVKMKSMSFEDKMSKFLKDSTERQEQLKSRESKRGQSRGR
ncbi:S1 RNA-binding domain-containing protein [Clostridiisalibacter paucivorans]|uniref:S1 RNA-binding domain-containing protein n=1 Tax=Clostridiisalibacter paucivorans TaxID=408753 RepID=UPI00047C354F|nr:S1 RNA-binding domain-containing protein [Clostridiisalibacter paucivorans]